MNIYTLSPSTPFLDTLAKGLLNPGSSDPLHLSSTLILLPTRRACRSLRESFLRHSQRKATLLPRLLAVGDVDDISLYASPPEVFDIPPSISPLRRQLLLARLIMASQAKKPTGTPSMTWDKAGFLARDLAHFLDESQTEQCSFESLQNLVPEHYAAHWQTTLEFLRTVTEAWPKILHDEGALDPANRRNRLLLLQADFWRRHPPSHPVIAAGMTGTIPAVAQLIKVVARLPQGQVLLPGLDLSMDEETWEAIDEQHPMHGLSSLLKALDVPRSNVKPWPPTLQSDMPPFQLSFQKQRENLLRETFRPSSTTEKWQDLAAVASSVDPRFLDDFQRVDAANLQEEAQTIAFLMREDLHIPGYTTALITPHPLLARHVESALQRWDIQVDNSAGTPLPQTPIGTFLTLLLGFISTEFDPVSFLALLKHPLTGLGLSPVKCRSIVRYIETHAIRVPHGWNMSLSALRSSLNDPAARSFLETIEGALSPLAACASHPSAPLTDWIQAHIQIAEAFAATDHSIGSERLWTNDDGEAMAQTMADFLESSRDFPSLTSSEYPGFFKAIIDGIVVRPSYGSHPRLFILGPLEGRLQHFDHIILGGLNEGDWPSSQQADPWMSRPMRKDFGLLSPEFKVGQAAHDAMMATHGPRVTLTRSKWSGGAPTIPSRWLLRLDTVLKKMGLSEHLTKNAPLLLGRTRDLDKPPSVRSATAPQPKPPLSARPKELSVTDVELWIRDPYSVYAKHILKLKKLEPLIQDPTASHQGQFIHDALDRFIKSFPMILPDNALDVLLKYGREAFEPLIHQPHVRSFWWPRFESIAGWFVQWEKERRSKMMPVVTEHRGRIVVTTEFSSLTLKAKADRIDRDFDGHLAIVDYKTGQLPTTHHVGLGFSPQLALEGLIAQQGGFPDVPPSTPVTLLYLRLSGKKGEEGEEKFLEEPQDHIQRAADGLKNLISHFSDPSTAYLSRPHPAYAPRYSDYEHLARIQEWSIAEDSDD